ncbi:MAG: ABC transporter ATP-binding protein [Bacilli bacterium]
MATLRIDNLKVSYFSGRKNEAIIGINKFCHCFEDGYFYVVLGPSGSGKSTLIKAIAGLVNYEGTITINDIDCELLSYLEKNIAYVSQTYDLNPHWTIFQNIAFPLKIKMAPREEIIKEVNEIASPLELDYLLSRKPRQLSGGQQQRAALARALVKRPSLFLLDEPFSNVDEQQRDFERRMFQKMVSERKVTTILATHDVKEALLLADFILFLHEGLLIFSGSPREFINSNNPLIRETIMSSGIKIHG